MDDLEKAREKAVKFLKTIKTLGDLKAHKEEILDLIEEIFKAGVQSVVKFFETAESLSDEEKQKQIERFQDDNYLFSDDLGVEMERIDELPGAIDYIESFKDELEARMAPHLEEFGEYMMKVMTGVMGGLVEGMAEGFGEMMGEMGESEAEEEKRVEYYTDDFEEFRFLSYIRNMDELKEEKENLLWHIEEEYKDDIENLKTLVELDWSYSEMQNDVEEIEKRQSVIAKEIEFAFKTLSTLPDSKEVIDEVKGEVEKLKKPLQTEVDQLLKKVKDRKEK